MEINIFANPGLFMTGNINHAISGAIVQSGVQLPEVLPGKYSINLDVPTVTTPVPYTKPEDMPWILVPPKGYPKPIPVIVTATASNGEVYSGSNILTPHSVLPILVPRLPINIDNSERCPYCFSKIGLATDIHNFQWSDDPTLCMGSKVMNQYRGFMQIKANHIKELQDNRVQLETDLGIIPLTEFSPIDLENFYQMLCNYILELRDSTEKILTSVGMTKDTYFNYNELNTEMRTSHQTDWIDAVDLTSEALTKFQIKGLHIEDLRHYIQSILIERWNKTLNKSYGIGGYTGEPFTGDFGVNTWNAINTDPPLKGPDIQSFIWSTISHPGGDDEIIITTGPIYNQYEGATVEVSGGTPLVPPVIPPQNFGGIIEVKHTATNVKWDSQIPATIGGHEHIAGGFYFTTGGIGSGRLRCLFPTGRLILNNENIFTLDLLISHANSTVDWTAMSLGGLGYSSSRSPELLITITLTDGLGNYQYYQLKYGDSTTDFSGSTGYIFVPGISYPVDRMIDAREFSSIIPLIPVQIDLYTLMTVRLRDIYYEKDIDGNPILDIDGNKIGNMKYLYDFGTLASLSGLGGGGSGVYDLIVTGNASEGYINYTLDNIGLIKKP